MPKTTVGEIEIETKGRRHGELMPLLEAMFREFQLANKKKADAPLNKRKVEIVNRLLKDVFDILEGEAMRSYLDLLDEDDLPQNSDVVLMLGQTVAAMEAFEKKYHRYSSMHATKIWTTNVNQY
jgi:hypothetical protein